MRRPAPRLLLVACLSVGTYAEAADPGWTGDLAIRRCTRTTTALPAGLPDTMAAAVEITAGYSSGTGFLVSPDGYVITAAHVVRGFDTVDVRVGGRPTTRATVLRISTERDVAVLYTGGQDLPCVPETLLDSPVGADLWVIGAPRGDEAFSVMRGVVSATRTIAGARLLQTDAAVNPGDSGGAMVDGMGHVRALVSFKVSGALYEGIGFGVPIATALDSLDLVLGDKSEADPLSKAGLRLGVTNPTTTPFDDAGNAAIDARFAAIREAQEAKKRKTAIGLTVGGAVGLLAGGGMYFGTLGRYLAARDLPDTDPSSIDRAEWRSLQAVSATGLTLAGTGALLTLIGGLQWRSSTHELTVVPTPGGVGLAGVFP